MLSYLSFIFLMAHGAFVFIFSAIGGCCLFPPLCNLAHPTQKQPFRRLLLLGRISCKLRIQFVRNLEHMTHNSHSLSTVVYNPWKRSYHTQYHFYTLLQSIQGTNGDVKVALAGLHSLPSVAIIQADKCGAYC